MRRKLLFIQQIVIKQCGSEVRLVTMCRRMDWNGDRQGIPARESYVSLG